MTSTRLISARVTRLAPSPTGALHLGNARTFLLNWLIARRSGWRILLRIEDLDGPRIKRNADKDLIDDLRWLGLDWDDGPIYQSTRASRYTSAVDQLLAARHAYPCTCSRREVELSASAPHAEDGAAVYSGTCRDKYADMAAARTESGREPAIRFRVPAGAVRWLDQFRGPEEIDAERQLGDFVIVKGDGLAAYQLAVVVDDAAMGVTDVVRGDDLIESTPRQILLYRALGLEASIPRHTHLPLVVGPDGRRLAKRHGDTRISSYRALGTPPGRILSLLARWSGQPAPAHVDSDDLTASAMVDSFDLAAVPRSQVVFTEKDDAWLRA